VDCDPDDLAGFYGGEEFMELFCVLPFVGTLMMRGGEFDDEGTVHTTGLPGEMLVSMVFSDEDDDEGVTSWFNKRERFKDVCMGSTCWDMVSNFGFRTLPSGKIEVYHTGEYFASNLPVLGGVVYFVFKFHSMWLAWATKHYLQNYAFTSETEEEEEMEELARTDMPLHLLVNVLPYEIKAPFYRLFGVDAGPHPCKGRRGKAAELEIEEEEGVEEREVHLQRIMTRVSEDIKKDREQSKVAVIRRMATIRANPEAEIAPEVDLETEKVGKDRGGPKAWEALKRTNDPQAYLKATRMAIRRREPRVGKPLGRKGTRVDTPRSAGYK